MNKLAACPFCGCEMHIHSNRDWHRLNGEHEVDCVFDQDEPILTYPATDEMLAELIECWNKRSTPVNAQVRNETLCEAQRHLKTRLDQKPLDSFDEGFNAAVDGDIAVLETLKS